MNLKALPLMRWVNEKPVFFSSLAVLLLIGASLVQVSCSEKQNPAADALTFVEFTRLCDGQQPTQADLLAVLQGRDAEEISSAILFSIKYSLALDSMPVFQAIWSGDANVFSALDMEFLAQPVIRLAVASALAKINPQSNDEYLSYVDTQLDSDNSNVRRHAIMAMAHVGNTNAIARLHQTAIRNNGEYLALLASSMLAINEMRALLVLESLTEEFGANSENGKLISDITKPYRDNPKAHRCGHH